MTIDIKNFEYCIPGVNGKLNFPGYITSEKGLILLKGNNGSGKSTFLKRIQKNNHLIIVDGKIQKIALMNQHFNSYIFPYKPIWWNISLPSIISEKLSKENAIELAGEKVKEFNLDIDVNRLPLQIENEELGLSGGEIHLIIFLRMSLLNHNILLFDEPTAGVDQEKITLLWTLLFKLNDRARKAIIIVTHDHLNHLKVIDRIIFNGYENKALELQLVVK